HARRDLDTVARVPDGEVARLIDPYIGGMASADIPLPALIEADVASNADVATVARAVARPPAILATPAAREAGAFTRLIGALRGTASLVMLVCVAATGLVAMLAARAALAADRASLAILHELGATDDQLAALVLRRIGRDAAIGAGAGLLLGGVALAMVASRLAPLGLGGLGWGWLLLPLVPAGLVGLALLAGYATLLLSLGRAP
ncbi:hypothetical protein, partial [Sphingomonas sp.]|uniref:hypothetical protein n=1 Tax=Sphingomonas sp. TaxID=28214 RepID=UPI003B3A4332